METPDEEKLRMELQEIATPAEDKCAICQATRRRHKQLEEAGELHHSFSTQGELVHTKPEPRRRVVPTADLVLRMAMLQKGLLTSEDLLRAEMKLRDAASVSSGQGSGDPGDSEDRER